MRKKVILLLVIVVLVVVSIAVGIFLFGYQGAQQPGVPTGFTATVVSSGRIDLVWAKGEFVDTTYIERNLLSSWERGDGVLIYNETGISYQDSGLAQNTQYYYQAWGWNQTNNAYSTTFAAVDNITFVNQPLVFSVSNPSNGSANISFNVIWSIPITDPEGDVFSWTIQCSNGQKSDGTGASNGTKSLSLSGLSNVTAYTVWVNATDVGGSGVYTRGWYRFTTKSNLGNTPPVYGTPSPANGSTGNLLSFSWSIPITDPQGDVFSWTIQCSNGQKSNGAGASNGTKSLLLSGLSNVTAYTVWVNATDPDGSAVYTRRWYRFTTKSNQGNTPPVYGTPSPANGSTGNLLSLSWSMPITDPQGNVFSWTIQCSNGQVMSGTGASNGTKSLSLSGLASSTVYKVWVNATDPDGSGQYIRRWYTFTTKANSPPTFGVPVPANASTGNLLNLTWSIPISDLEGNAFSWSIQCSNGQKSNGTGASNGTKSLSLSGLASSTVYKVWVNATDAGGSGGYMRRWYRFTTKSNQGNTPPVFGTSSPANGSTGNLLSLSWSIPITDPQGDVFSWTIQCNNKQVNSGSDASNGTKSLSLSGLTYATTYTVWVNVTDPGGSGQYTRRWYTFTTKVNTPPTFGVPVPANASTGNLLNVTWSIPISDLEGNAFSWTIQCSNGQKSNGTAASNGTKSLPLSGLTNITTYKVWVNATDVLGSGLYTRRWYSFTTKQPDLPPTKPGTPTGQTQGRFEQDYTYTTSATDPNGDRLYYMWDWGDGTTSGWLGPFNSGVLCTATHRWNTTNIYSVLVKAKDTTGLESPWSNLLSVTIHPVFIVSSGMVIVDAKITSVEQLDTFQYSFVGDPVEKVTVIGYGAYNTGHDTDMVPRFSMKTFTNVSEIQGIAYKTLQVSDAYQQFSFIVTPRNKAFLTVV